MQIGQTYIKCHQNVTQTLKTKTSQEELSSTSRVKNSISVTIELEPYFDTGFSYLFVDLDKECFSRFSQS